MGERLIFVLSTGRCATAWLAEQMALVPGVLAAHEPRPNFVGMSMRAHFDREGPRRFWQDRKLPMIRAQMKRAGASVYVETNHVLANNGMAESLLELDPVPDVIIIHRDPREIALEFWRRDSIPGRTRRGGMYLQHPRALRGWKELSGYQLCYWHVLETYRRIEELAPKIRTAGSRVVQIETSYLTTKAGFAGLCRDLCLQQPTAFLTEEVNAAPEHVRSRFPKGDLDEMEAKVAVRMAEEPERKPTDKPHINVYLVNTGSIRAELSGWRDTWATDDRYYVTTEESRGFPVTHNRNQVALKFLAGWGDWMLMVDEDVVPQRNPLDLVRVAEERGDMDVIVFPVPMWKAGVTGPLPIDMNIGLLNDGGAAAENLPQGEFQSILPLRVGGTGAILVRRRVLEDSRLRWPFADRFDEDGLRRSGSDITFTARAQAAGYKLWAPMDYACKHYKTLNLLEILQAFDDYIETLKEEWRLENGLG